MHRRVSGSPPAQKDGPSLAMLCNWVDTPNANSRNGLNSMAGWSKFDLDGRTGCLCTALKPSGKYLTGSLQIPLEGRPSR